MFWMTLCTLACMASLLGAGACEAAGAAVATYAPRSFSVPTVKVQTHKAPVVKRRLRRNSLSVASQSGLRETPDPLELSSSVAYMIDQDTGEVYFEVARDKAHPFIVSVNDVEIEVLGTAFNIAAYGEKVVTTLVDGRVKVCTPADSAFLQVNEQASWDGKQVSIRHVEAENYTLWRKGIFCFNDTRLEDIMDALARWYDVHVFFQNPRMKNDRYSVEIRRYEEIDTILRRMAETNRVKFSVNGRTVSVYE